MPPKKSKSAKKAPQEEEPEPAPVRASRTRTKSGEVGASEGKQPAKKVKADTSPKKPAKSAEKEEPEEMKKMVMTGGAPVDEYFGNKNSAHVLSEGGVTYSTTLNQSNVQDNNNKFYILQILESDSGVKQYWFFTRWGRVGVQGQQAAIPYPNMVMAIREYSKKKRAKITGGYREIVMNYEPEE